MVGRARVGLALAPTRQPPGRRLLALFARLVDRAAAMWQEPDHGIWETRGEPQHFLFSKVVCRAAVDGGLRLAEESLRKAPEKRWRRVCGEIRAAVAGMGTTGTAASLSGPSGAGSWTRRCSSCRR